MGFGPDDPLFPATQLGKGPNRSFIATGLSRKPWRTTTPIRLIFRNAFTGAGLPYANPHIIRNTLVRLGQRLCTTPETCKAWSQNLGHESETTTFVGYGHVPGSRQSELLRELERTRRAEFLPQLDLAALRKFLDSV